ncbi:MAG TPA: Ig-like domain-containing protein [Anaerolineae bacterium]|nr:Ig-like domain-containing protein [Anaerolineae bacterium]
MRRFLLCCILLLTTSLMLAACGAAAQGPMSWLDRPLDGAVLPLAAVTIQAHASDADGVASFQFYVDDAPLVTTSAGGGRLGMAMVEWNPTEPGTYTIRARGVDTQGNAGSEAKSVVTVGEVQTPSPTTSLPPEATPAGPPPEVQIDFTANRTNLMPGECAMLLWSVQGGEAVLLQGEPVPFSGEREACPQETTPYALAVYVGVGPPSPPVAERELVIVVGEPPATTPSPTYAAPTATAVPPSPTPRATTAPSVTPVPTSPPGCPGPPVISFFTASPGTITTGQSSTLSWGAVTNGNSAVLVSSVVINPGLGEVGSPGSRVVSPASTTTYTLVATGCGGTAQQQVTVVVNPADFSADLAITDLYPDTLPQGAVYARITNHGPSTVNNVNLQLSCQGDPYLRGLKMTSVSSSLSVSVSLNPGQTGIFDTDVSIDTEQFDYYSVTCSIQVPFNDSNTSNNSYTERIPPQ